MMTDPDDLLSRPRLRGMQIIAGSLILGVVLFLGIALYIVLVQNDGKGMNPPPNLPIISLLAVAMLGMNVPLAFVLPGMQTRAALRQIAANAWQVPQGADPSQFGSDRDKLMTVRQTTLIIALALVEGAAFLAGIAYLLEGQAFALVLVAGAILVMLLYFPTEGRVCAWLELQANRLAELRQQGDGGS